MRLLVVTAMRNEGPFLVEWVAWLRLIGITDVLVFSNDCEDGTDAVLDLLAPVGVHHVRQAPPPSGRSVQWQALRAAWAHPLRAQADWAMVLDCDEFPVPLDGGPLTAHLHGDAVALPWRLFGHNGHVAPPRAPTTAAFTRAAPCDLSYPAAAHFIKSAFRLAGPFTGFGVHRPKQAKGAAPDWRGPDGAALPADFAARQGRINLWGLPLGVARVQLNHYSVRSAESFLVKRDRGLPNHTEKEIGLSYWVERNFNAETDESALAFQPVLAREMASLRAVPGVAAAEQGARDWHGARFAALMQDPEMARLFGRLILSAGSQPPEPRLGQALVRAYGDAVRGAGS